MLTPERSVHLGNLGEFAVETGRGQPPLEHLPHRPFLIGGVPRQGVRSGDYGVGAETSPRIRGRPGVERHVVDRFASQGTTSKLRERCRHRRATHPARVKPELVASGPNQVYSWDF